MDRDQVLLHVALLRRVLDAAEQWPTNGYLARRVERMFQSIHAPRIDDAAERDLIVRQVRLLGRVLYEKRKADADAGLVPYADMIDDSGALVASDEAIVLVSMLSGLPGELGHRARFAQSKLALAIEAASRPHRPRRCDVAPPPAAQALEAALAALDRPGSAGAVRQQRRRARRG